MRFFKTEVVLDGNEKWLNEPATAVPLGEIRAGGSEGSGDIEALFALPAFDLTPTEPEGQVSSR